MLTAEKQATVIDNCAVLFGYLNVTTVPFLCARVTKILSARAPDSAARAKAYTHKLMAD
jgi:hypothetical protein